MRHVEVKITADDPEDKRAVNVQIMEDRGAGNVVVGGQDLVVNMDKKVFDLRPGQSITVQNPITEMKVDRDQFYAFDPATQSEQARREGRTDTPRADDKELQQKLDTEHQQRKIAADRTKDDSLRARVEQGPEKASEAQGVPVTPPRPPGQEPTPTPTMANPTPTPPLRSGATSQAPSDKSGPTDQQAARNAQASVATRDQAREVKVPQQGTPKN